MHKGEFVTILMPVYNEEKTVTEMIRRTIAQKMIDKLIVINDNSSDRSLEKIMKEKRKNSKIGVITNKKNKGKGYNIRLGIRRAKTGLILIQDADKEYFPEDYSKLFAKLRRDNVVFGTRMLGKNTGHVYKLAKLGNEAMTSLFNILFNQRITDLYTCYKLFRKSLLKDVKLTQNSFLIEAELAIAFAKQGCRIDEAGIRYKGRTYEEGKKINAVDGIKGFLFVFKKAIVP